MISSLSTSKFLSRAKWRQSRHIHPCIKLIGWHEVELHHKVISHKDLGHCRHCYIYTYLHTWYIYICILYILHSIDFAYILNITISHMFHNLLPMLCMSVVFLFQGFLWYFAGPKCHVVAHSQRRPLWRFPRQGVGHLYWMLHAVSCSHSPRMVWPYRCQGITQAGGPTLPQCNTNPYIPLPSQCDIFPIFS